LKPEECCPGRAIDIQPYPHPTQPNCRFATIQPHIYTALCLDVRMKAIKAVFSIVVWFATSEIVSAQDLYYEDCNQIKAVYDAGWCIHVEPSSTTVVTYILGEGVFLTTSRYESGYYSVVIASAK
ncbi:MAG: hypothetical protein AAFQ89_23400, partial [Cyanobacteria bacterium J06626_18]